MPIIPLIQQKALPDAPAAVMNREKFPTVNNRGVQQAAGELGSVKSPLLPAEQLSAPFRALGAVGEAIQQTGSVIGALARTRMQAETDVQVAQADAEMEGELARFDQWKTETNAPTNTWESEWQKRMAGLQGKISQRKDLTPGARQDINLRMVRFGGQAQARVMAGAARESFAQAKSAFVAQIDRYTDGQNPEGFEEALTTAEKRGYLYPHEAENFRQRFKDTGERKQKEATATAEKQEYDMHTSEAIADPEKWLAANGKEPWKGKEILWQRVKNAADARQREVTVASVDEVVNAIAEGTITVEAEVDAWDSKLPPKLRQEAKQYLRSRDAFAEKKDRDENGVRNAVELRRKVADYDPQSDPERRGYFELVREIGGRVEQSMAGELTGELFRKYGRDASKLKVRPEIEQNVSKSLDVIFDAETGAIPYRKKVPVIDAKGRPVKDLRTQLPETTWQEDPAAKQRAIDAQTAIEIKMTDWFKEHPDATLPEVKKKLGEVLPEGTRLGALEALQKLKAPQAAAGGSVTSYGYAGDSTPDSNSSAGIGAFVPREEEEKIRRGEDSPYRLRRGDIAVSPDVESQLRAAGVREGETILVRLANGEVRRARWMDRTAQDDDVRSGRIKGVSRPLRGRFDFYSPGGRDEADGVAVVGWSKA